MNYSHFSLEIDRTPCWNEQKNFLDFFLYNPLSVLTPSVYTDYVLKFNY